MSNDLDHYKMAKKMGFFDGILLTNASGEIPIDTSLLRFDSFKKVKRLEMT